MKGDSILQHLPYYNLTPVEFLDTISSIKQSVSTRNNMNNFLEKLQETLPENIFNNINCKYYCEESLNNLKITSQNSH